MKLQDLRKHMKAKGLSACMFFSDDPNYTYFARSNASGLLVVPEKKQPFIITNRMEAELLRQETSIRIELADGKKATELVKSRLGHIKAVGINKHSLTLGMLSGLKQGLKARFQDVSEACELLRAIKTPDELHTMRNAASITTKVFRDFLKTHPATELRAVAFLESRMRRLGTCPAFNTIVAAGSNASKPHHMPSKKRLSGAVVLDFGVRLNFLNSDFSRTVFFRKPTKLETQAYNAVLAAQLELIAHIKPGIKVSTLSKLAKLKLSQWKPNILHSYGHGIGVAVHEFPTLSESSDARLKEGMVLAIEPGLYFQGRFGIRIEDMVAVTKHGAEVLTDAEK
jgi:Xaa-Pro aminopeptidase